MARGYELLRVEPDPRPEPVVERESDSELERLRRALEEREAALSQATAESAELRRRLEATELGRSAREQALQDSEQERAKPRAGDQPPQALESSHLVFVPRGGSYELLERTGPPPDVGEKVAEGENRDKRFLVAKVARSPLPLDPRACAYLCALD